MWSREIVVNVFHEVRNQQRFATKLYQWQRHAIAGSQQGATS